MNRFIPSAILLWLALTALCGMMVVIRRATAGPNEMELGGFRRCGDGTPCYWGITPGITPMKDAHDILYSVQEQFAKKYTKGLTPRAYPTTCDEKLVVCRIEYYAVTASGHPPYTAGTLIEQYGLPDWVYYDGYGVGFHYPGLYAIAVTKGSDQLSVNSPIYQIILIYNPLDTSSSVPCLSKLVSPTGGNSCWRGFALKHYKLD